MNWTDILVIQLQEPYSLSVWIGPIFWGTLVIGGLLLWIFKSRVIPPFNWETVECSVPIGTLGTVVIKPNYQVAQIAHQAWTELSTRKAAIPFDEGKDVIVEIYDSWYELFKEIRALIKEIPAHKIRNDENTEKLVKLLITILNDGLRPHLTSWQAKFRKWYEGNQENNRSLSPQEIQKLYPEYNILVSDLKIVNQSLISLNQCLKKLSHGD